MPFNRIPHLTTLMSFLANSFVFLIIGIVLLSQGGWIIAPGSVALLVGILFGAAALVLIREQCRKSTNSSKGPQKPRLPRDPTQQSLITLLLVAGALLALLSGSSFYQYQRVGASGKYTELTRYGSPVEHTGRYALGWGVGISLMSLCASSVGLTVWWKTRP